MATIPGIGLAKGLWVTLKAMLRRPVTVMWPDEKELLAPRARGVIALDVDNCTSCMLCGRECPDWCIYIEGHKEEQPPSKPGGRVKKRATLDRFDIDYAEVMGQEHVKRALEIAAAGGHNLIMIGPPGSGKPACCPP